jgi:hypothetical protein
VHAGTAYQFSSHANLLLQLNGKFQGKADVGETGEPGENTGGTFVYLSPGLNVDVMPHLSAYGYLQIPVYQRVNGIQQTSRYNIQFGLSADIGLLD